MQALDQPGLPDPQAEWEAQCPAALTRDLLWKLQAYRAGLYLLHLANEDGERLRERGRAGVADQLLRAAASVSANVAEGYGRSGRADRIKFLDYALGSARECTAWYEASRGVLSAPVLELRHAHISKCRGLLLGLIRSLRSRAGAPKFRR